MPTLNKVFGNPFCWRLWMKQCGHKQYLFIPPAANATSQHKNGNQKGQDLQCLYGI